jgi:hypothetical protein
MSAVAGGGAVGLQNLTGQQPGLINGTQGTGHAEEHHHKGGARHAHKKKPEDPAQLAQDEVMLKRQQALADEQLKNGHGVQPVNVQAINNTVFNAPQQATAPV